MPPIATKAVAGIDAKDVRVECYSDGLKVFIEKSRLPWIRSSENLHFLDPACIGKFEIYSCQKTDLILYEDI